MAQTVLITLTTAGLDTGPFNLYSDADAYFVPFESGVSKVSLVLGYTSIYVPDDATIIRIKSANVLCNNYIDLVLVTTTTTTSTSTSSTSTTTSTTTTAAPITYSYYIADRYSCVDGSCGSLIAPGMTVAVVNPNTLTINHYYAAVGDISPYSNVYKIINSLGSPGISPVIDHTTGTTTCNLICSVL